MNNEEKILAILERMEGDISVLKADVAGIKVRIDVDIPKQLSLLAEGHQTLLETLAPKSRVEALEDEMAFLKSVIKSMGQRIADLEKAQ